MSERDLECVVWCPDCKQERFRVYRSKAGSGEGVYQNRIDPPQGDHMRCADCGCNLERKP